MKELLRVLIGVVLAAVLSLGWAWTGYLKDQGWVSDQQRLWVLVFISIALVGQQLYALWPRPSPRGQVEARSAVVQTYLKTFIREYNTAVRRVDRAANPRIRVNVMLPCWRFLHSRARLRIFYVASSHDAAYSEEERTALWRKGEGTCGWAWKHRNVTFFDAEREEHRGLAVSLRKEKSIYVRKVRSILSVPIWHNETIVGILNIDSRDHSGVTKLHVENIVHLASRCAQEISSLCPRAGVER